jgi:hypothetical protein
MEHKEYNGWYNHETWLAGLWIDNDEGSYNTRQELAEEAWEASENPPLQAPYLDRDDRALRLLEKSLKKWILGQNPLEASGFFNDLMNSALYEINWQELARHYLDEHLETLDDNDEETA